MTTLLPIAVAILIVLSAILAAAETALFTLWRMEHTREQLSRGVRDAIERLMKRPLESLIVMIGLSEACNIFAECLGTIILIAWLGGTLGTIVAAPVMLATVLILCDITPKTFAIGFPAVFARIAARPLASLSGAMHPILRHVAPAETPPGPGPVSESEFKALLKLGETGGQVEPAEREMIHRVFDFGARRAFEVMTPRERMFTIDVATPPGQVIGEVAQESYSRVPVWRGNPDNIVGILHAKDLAARRLEPHPPRIERIMRQTTFIPPNKALGELFDEMRRNRFQVAIVVDEYGKVLGLVTLEDLLEELFGEIRDEFDLDIPDLTQVSEREWTASGAIELKKLAAALAPALLVESSGGGKRLSGLILRRLGRVPRAGEKFKLGDFEATVERVRGATIELVRLSR
ncbi:MAG TPA: hemolysin family protein [Candidatus Binataceae bacterium]|nr:hemolysin family protein [Candidatus Binataceae bacterium]